MDARRDGWSRPLALAAPRPMNGFARPSAGLTTENDAISLHAFWPAIPFLSDAPSACNAFRRSISALEIGSLIFFL